ncbi:D-alanyl-D-alanine carboxypeptidase family protein [Brackiella oedipodis]|uniref:D-alanyl-D-alanine carboxypeptidase family protein n=1 Tax=Brackiella oedipodis TaxID=124225 RepID=UPI00048C2C3A|nr:D-alanyl-D-alanine carboxypeptidase family protein [Brackiella oedipodis]
MFKRILIILLLVVIVVGGYLFFFSDSKTNAPQSKNSQVLLEAQPQKTAEAEEASNSTVPVIDGNAPTVAAMSHVAPPQVAGLTWLLLDADSNQVIAEQNGNQRVEPASLTKLMTTALVFEALQKGQISLDQMVTVSPEARAQEGSRMFIEVNTQVSVEQLINGMLVQSGNDATVQLAQVVGGSIPNFVQKMNQKAQAWGLSNSHFDDPAGMPSEGTYISTHDIAVVALHLIKDYPEYYHFFGVKEYTYAKIRQPNRNGLLNRGTGVDGMKTGHTKSAGYNLLASAKQGDRRLISVVIGTKSFRERENANQALLNWGFSQFAIKSLAKAGQPLTESRVWEGKSKKVALGSLNDVAVTVPRGQENNVQAITQFDSNRLVAPLAKNQAVGSVQFLLNNQVIKQDTLVTLNAVERAGFFGRMWDKLMSLFN